MKQVLADLALIFLRELRIELRTRETLSAMGIFGIVVLTVFNFAFPPGTRDMALLAPGILWVAFTFAGILGMNRSFAREREDGALQGILLSPVDRGVLFLGKLAALLVGLLVMEALLLALFGLFFSVNLLGPEGVAQPMYFVLVLLLGTLGFVTIGTLFAAIAAQTRFQEVLLPIMLIPLVAPVLIAAVKATGAALQGTDPEGLWFWLKFLATFDGVFLVASFLAFEYVVQE